MSIGSRIKQRREELGLTQPELAKLMNVSKGTIGNYETGVSYPNEKNFFKLFEILKCDANYLYQDDIKKMEQEIFSDKEKKIIKKYRILDKYSKEAVDSILDIEYKRCTAEPVEEEDEEPMLEIRCAEFRVSAGFGVPLEDSDQWETIFVPDTNDARKASFALKIKGDSMEPVFYEGDIVLVKQQEVINEGEIGIFIVESEGYIKKYGGDRLISLNDEYDDILFADCDPDRIKCAGKVIGRV